MSANSQQIAGHLWLGAVMERLRRRKPPFPLERRSKCFAQESVVAHRESFGFQGWPTWGHSGVNRWDYVPVDPIVAEVMREALRIVRGKPWEESFWEEVNILGLPSDVVTDLIGRKVALSDLGHMILEDALLWKLADEVDEALLTLAKRRYLSALYDADRLEEVLHAYPDHEWMLWSLAQLVPDSGEKAKRLSVYVRALPKRVYNRVTRSAVKDLMKHLKHV